MASLKWRFDLSSSMLLKCFLCLWHERTAPLHGKQLFISPTLHPGSSRVTLLLILPKLCCYLSSCLSTCFSLSGLPFSFCLYARWLLVFQNSVCMSPPLGSVVWYSLLQLILSIPYRELSSLCMWEGPGVLGDVLLGSMLEPPAEAIYQVTGPTSVFINHEDVICRALLRPLLRSPKVKSEILLWDLLQVHPGGWQSPVPCSCRTPVPGFCWLMARRHHQHRPHGPSWRASRLVFIQDNNSVSAVI